MKFLDSPSVPINKSKTNRTKSINQNYINNTDALNIDEIMTKNKLKKFREIGSDLNTSIGKENDSKNDKIKDSGFNLYDELVDNIVSYNIEKSPYVFNPDSKLKVIWDLIGMVFIIYQGIIVPFRICFDTQAEGSQAVFELIQDFYFLIDILISFNTGFYENGNLNMIRCKIILNYLKLWFWLDTAASFPYSLVVNVSDYFDTSGSGSSKEKAPQILRLLKFMRFMRFLRLIRVLKLKKILVRFEEFIMSDSFNILIQFSKLLFIVLFIAHWGGCFWFFLGTSEFQDKGNSWLTRVNLIDSSTFDQYISSIYYFITTMTTVGYGDITPVTSNEKMFAMMSMILACGVFAYVIGSIGTVLSSKYDEEMIFKQKIMYVDQYLRNKKLSTHVRTKVRRYLEHVLDNKREQRIDESEILNLLNKNLKEEVIMHLNGLLLKNPVFMVLSKYDEFCLLLTNIMREETLNPGDIIFQKGDHSLRLYFINNGMVTIFDQDSKIVFKEINNRAPYSCFGEIGFFAGQKRCASAESLTFTSLTYILMDLFKEVAYRFKQMQSIKFKIFEDDLLLLRKEIRQKNYTKLKLKCYLCDSNVHIASDCTKLKSFDEYFKFNFKDKKHKTEAEIKKVFDLISKNSGSTQMTQTYQHLNLNMSNPSFTKNTKDSFFSYAGVYSDDEGGQEEQNSIIENKNMFDNIEEDSSSSGSISSKSKSSNKSISSKSNKSLSKSSKKSNRNSQNFNVIEENNESESASKVSKVISKENSKSKSISRSISKSKSLVDLPENLHNEPEEPEESEEEKSDFNKITNETEILTLDDNRTKFGKLLKISEGKKKKFN